MRNRFAPLRDLIDDEEEDFSDLGDCDNVPEIWEHLKNQTHTIAANTKFDKIIYNPWITAETMDLVKKRTEARVEAEKARVPSKSLRDKLKNLRKQIKKATRKDKEQYYEEMAAKAEKASSMGDQKEVFRVLRALTGGRSGAVDLKERRRKVDRFLQRAPWKR